MMLIAARKDLEREIDEIIYSLRRRKHDLYQQNDSNQARLRKRRNLCNLKKKLKERILHYNTVCASGQTIDTEAACSLSDDVILPWDDVILPWDVQGDVASFCLKRRLFDQVMLVRRVEEEKLIIVKEMTQHYQDLRRVFDKLDNHLHKTEEDIKNHTSPTGMTEGGHGGLRCCLLQKQHLLLEKLSSVASTYACFDVDSSLFVLEEDKDDDDEEERQHDDSSSDLSEEDI